MTDADLDELLAHKNFCRGCDGPSPGCERCGGTGLDHGIRTLVASYRAMRDAHAHELERAANLSVELDNAEVRARKLALLEAAQICERNGEEEDRVRTHMRKDGARDSFYHDGRIKQASKDAEAIRELADKMPPPAPVEQEVQPVAVIDDWHRHAQAERQMVTAKLIDATYAQGRAEGERDALRNEISMTQRMVAALEMECREYSREGKAQEKLLAVTRDNLYQANQQRDARMATLNRIADVLNTVHEDEKILQRVIMYRDVVDVTRPVLQLVIDSNLGYEVIVTKCRAALDYIKQVQA